MHGLQLGGVLDTFRAYDAQGTGRIGLQELHELFESLLKQKSDARLIMEAVGRDLASDIDADGQVNYEAFLSWLCAERVSDGFASEAQTPRRRVSYDAPLGHRLRAVSVHHLQTAFLEYVDAAGYDRNAKIYDIEPTVIRPMGEGTRCPRDGQMGAAYVDVLRSRDGAGLAGIMLSYTWGYTVGDIVDALGQYCVDMELEPKRTYVWMCCLCINQHRVKAARAADQVIPFDSFRQEFADRVRGIGHVVALMSPWHQPSYLSRVWCDFEMFTAAETQGVTLTIVMPPREMDDFREALLEKTGVDRVWRACAGVKVEEAQASVPVDRDRILSLIEEGPGFEALNSLIVKRLQEWMVDSSEGYLKQRLARGDVDTAADLILCNKVSKMLRQLGHQDRGGQILQEALRIHESAGTLVSMEGAALLAQIGIHQTQSDNYAGALDTLTKARRIHEHTHTLDTDKGALLMLSIGIVHAEQGEHCVALDAFRLAAETASRASVVRTNIGGQILRWRAESKEALGDFSGALADFEEAVQITVETNSLESPAGATLLERWGRIMVKTGNFAGALEHFRQAHRIRYSSNTLGCLNGAVGLRSYGDALRSTGDLDGALAMYREARRIFETIGALEKPEGILVTKHIADLEAERCGSCQAQRSLSLGHWSPSQGRSKEAALSKHAYR